MMNTKPVYPELTICTLDELVESNIANARAREAEIIGLEGRLKSLQNDWAEQSVIIKLTSARDEQERHIQKAAEYLQIVEKIRKQNGLDPSVLGRIIYEFNRGQ